MCEFTGCLTDRASGLEDLEVIVTRMADTIERTDLDYAGAFAERLFDQNRLNSEGYFYPISIRKKWAERLAGQRDHADSLWAVLMFQTWLQQQ